MFSHVGAASRIGLRSLCAGRGHSVSSRRSKRDFWDFPRWSTTPHPSDEATRAAAETAGSLLIAGHTNHSTFTEDEAIASAGFMRAHGATVEVSTLDSWGRRELVPTSAQLMALAREGLIDIIATDYAAGHWDGVFEAVEDIVRLGLASLEQAVAMVTGNVAKAVPRIGANRGVLRSGFLADLVIADVAHPADIDMVVIGGQVQLDDSGAASGLAH